MNESRQQVRFVGEPCVVVGCDRLTWTADQKCNSCSYYGVYNLLGKCATAGCCDYTLQSPFQIQCAKCRFYNVDVSQVDLTELDMHVEKQQIIGMDQLV